MRIEEESETIFQLGVLCDFVVYFLLLGVLCVSAACIKIDNVSFLEHQ